MELAIAIFIIIRMFTALLIWILAVKEQDTYLLWAVLAVLLLKY